MTLVLKSEIRNVKNISSHEKQRIYDFLQGAVYCWCKNREDEWFSIRDLMGGENFYWNHTPLMALFNKHKGKGKSDDDAIKGAGNDAGWILKKVLDDDVRNFETKHKDLVRQYKWKK